MSELNPRPDQGKTSYRGTGRLTGRRALITGGDSGIGRAVAIAFAREGADIAINYLPAEESDAREVTSLIRQAGRKAVAIPGDLRNETFARSWLPTPSETWAGSKSWSQRGAPEGGSGAYGPVHRRLRLDDEDEPLRAALDHQGGTAQPGRRLGDHHHLVGRGPQRIGPVLGLPADQGSPNRLRPITFQAARQPRHPRELGDARPLLDAASDIRRADPERIPSFGANTAYGRPGQPAEIEIASLYVQLAVEEDSFTSGMNYESNGGGYV